MKIFLSISILSICFLTTHVVHAEVVINEIMYDLEGTDTDREWIEIYNNGSESVDLASWKFVEANVNHGLVPDGSSVVSAGGYAIIAVNIPKFRIDWPNFSGIIFDSSFSLNNDPGETLALKNGTGTIVDQVTYTADPTGAHAGKSLQRNGSSWVIADPTPNTTNATSSTSNSGGSNAGGSSSSGDDEEDEAQVAVSKDKILDAEPQISVEIISKKLGIAGVPVDFEPRVRGKKEEQINSGKFTWNFGDGTEFVINSNSIIRHTYEYPGEYVVMIEYIERPNQLNPKITATDRVILSIGPQEIEIVSIKPDGGVEIKNTSSNEFELSSWILKSGTTQFIFPKNSYILPSQTLLVSRNKTAFSYGTTSVSLLYPSGQLALMFPKEVVVSTRSSAVNKTSSLSSSVASEESEIVSGPMFASNLEPEVKGDSISGDAEESGFKGNIFLLWIVLFVGFVIFSSIILLRIRKGSRKDGEVSSDDIELVD